MTLSWYCTRCVRRRLASARLKRLTKTARRAGVLVVLAAHPSKKRGAWTRSKKQKTDVLEVTNVVSRASLAVAESSTSPGIALVTVRRHRLRGLRVSLRPRGQDPISRRSGLTSRRARATTPADGQQQRGGQKQGVPSFVQIRAAFSEEKKHGAGDGVATTLPTPPAPATGKAAYPKLRRFRRRDLRQLMRSRACTLRVSTGIDMSFCAWLIGLRRNS